MELLKNIIEKQASIGLSDRAFARMLGVNSTLWNRTKRGQLQLDDTVLAAVLATFPEMEQQVAAYKLASLRERHAQALAASA